jgi:hypothetical protein
LADTRSADLLALKRTVEKKRAVEKKGERSMTGAVEQIRAVRLACELRIQASARRTFEVMTQQSLEWYPHTYGGDRVRRVVLEPRVGGQLYEDWGEGSGHLYGQVTVYDPPVRWATRGRVSAGTIMDTEYELTEEAGGVRVRVKVVVVGPLTDEDAAAIAEYGDISAYAPAIEELASG